jgi:hypothetical protein
VGDLILSEDEVRSLFVMGGAPALGRHIRELTAALRTRDESRAVLLALVQALRAWEGHNYRTTVWWGRDVAPAVNAAAAHLGLGSDGAVKEER